jgi:type I restriction enzyme M protein
MNKKLTEKELKIAELEKQVAELSKFKHERKGGSKKETLDQISTPAHISEFMKDLVSKGENNVVIDISCGAGSLLIPWKDTNALLIGADLDEEALEICKSNLPQSILFKHNSLECDTPCEIKEHIFYEGTSLEEISKSERERIFVMNPPFSLVAKMVSKVLEMQSIVGDQLAKINKVLIIATLSVAIGTKYNQERAEWLKKANLDAVLTLPGDLFAGQNTGTHTCLMVWGTKTSQPSETYLMNCKNDGFVVLKGKRFDKKGNWETVRKGWLSMYLTRYLKQPTIAVAKNLTEKDCWLADAWVETDYSQLTEKHFEKTIRDYLAFRISTFSDIDWSKNNNEK